MSINSRYAINQEAVSKGFGPNFGSIDFDVNSTSKELLEVRGGKTVAGTFYIGGKQFELTLAELDRAIETLQTAKSTFYQKFRFRL